MAAACRFSLFKNFSLFHFFPSINHKDEVRILYAISILCLEGTVLFLAILLSLMWLTRARFLNFAHNARKGVCAHS